MRSSRTYKPKGDFPTTYLWRVGKCEYRLQTENTRLKRVLKRRKTTKISASGINCPEVVFEMTYSRLSCAKKAFEYFTGIKAVYHREDDVYRAC
jgi:hypothetical protein